MITNTDLENPERELALETREAISEDRPARRRPESVELRALRDEAVRLREELAESKRRAAALNSRIEAARKIKPKGADLHCARCFGAGRDAALRALGEGNGKG